MDKNANTIRVAAAVADKKQVTLYLEDGEQLVIKQTDHRLTELLDAIIPITTQGEIAVISLDDFSVYAAFEKKSGGLTKFFKMAKNKVKGWFGSEPEVTHITLPPETQTALVNAVNGINSARENEQVPVSNSYADVRAHGTQISVTDEVGEDEVVVAVVGTPGNEKVIAGVDKIKPLIEHAVRTNSAGAVNAFLALCAQFIDKRGHSVDDILRFLEKGDLPLTEDGHIIAYKMLRNSNDKGVFVDCHTHKIRQKVGSFVKVDEKLVDLNRRNECSNGLHIARRGYLGGFGGDVCVLTKIHPEDVMTVPHGDPNKVRVKGYHILGVLSSEAMATLKANKPMTGEEAALRMVYDAIKGHHVGVLEIVEVHGQQGNNVTYTKVRQKGYTPTEDYQVTGSDLNKAAALDHNGEDGPALGVEPREINKRVNEELAKQGITGTTAAVILTDEGDDDMGVEEEYPDEAGEVDQEDLEAAGEKLDEVRSAIVGQVAAKPEPEDSEPRYHPAHVEDNQGVADPVPAPVAENKAQRDARIKREKRAAKKQAEVIRNATASHVTPDKDDPIVKRNAEAKAKPTPAKTTPPVKAVKAPKKPVANVISAPKPPKAGAQMTKAEEARKLYNANKLNDLRTFKKKAKKGWSVLGFSEAEIKKIEG